MEKNIYANKEESEEIIKSILRENKCSLDHYVEDFKEVESHE